jgi:hypothetical protein
VVGRWLVAIIRLARLVANIANLSADWLPMVLITNRKSVARAIFPYITCPFLAGILLGTQAGFWVLRPTQYVSQIGRTYPFGLGTQNTAWVPTTQNAA